MSAGAVRRAAPISPREFAQSLYSIWQPNPKISKPPHFGLAVSGGVDSMALATLCKQLMSQNNKFKLQCTAFVVDHKLRPESSEEAAQVADRLSKKLELETHVLPINWPSSVDLDSKTFETLARRYRFRTLGAACRDAGIERLMLAHHADDQAETLLMRMLTGRKGNALRGIRPVKEIPECYDMHGVYQSGGQNHLLRKEESPEDIRHNLKVSARANSKSETGGVQVLRPLLSFDKAQLIATCEANRTPWVEDPTNADPTLTSRNAIRHVFQNHKLPAALSRESLIAVSNRAEATRQERQKTVQRIYDMMPMKLDIQSGLLWVQFPESDKFNLSTDVSPEKLKHWQSVAALLLEKILMLVTPQQQIHHPHLSTGLDYLFPSLSPNRDSLSTSPPSSFTLAGVLFERNPRRGVPPSWPATSNTYLLSRRPLRKQSEGPALTVAYPPTVPDIPGEFVLFDNRFWIRVTADNASPEQTLVIRHVTENDLTRFRQALPRASRDHLDAKIREHAPAGKVFTLPGVVAVDQPYEAVKAFLETQQKGAEESTRVVEQDGQKGKKKKKETAEQAFFKNARLVALPTLDVRVPKGAYRDLAFLDDGFKCEWRYKKVELPAGRGRM